MLLMQTEQPEGTHDLVGVRRHPPRAPAAPSEVEFATKQLAQLRTDLAIFGRTLATEELTSKQARRGGCFLERVFNAF